MAQKPDISFISNKIKPAINDFAKACLTFLAVLVTLRLAFFFIAVCRMDLEWGKFRIIMSGLKFDAILTGSVTIVALVPFVATYCLSAKAARITANTLTIIYAVITSFLVEYFCSMSRPLDHVLFVYSADEVVNIVLSSTSVSLATILCITLPLCAVAGLMIASRNLKVNIIVSTICILFAAYGAFRYDYQKRIRKETGYKQHADFYLAVNQLSYTYIKLADYLKSDDTETVDTGIADAARHYQSLFPETDYLDIRYPFWRKADDSDVIGQFFNKTSDGNLPNIVFIIIESFGQKLTGVNHPTVSFTPFIDSLASNGLYWRNCLSTTERTFGVLPAIFASAPQGKNGFANMWFPIPDHNTIIKDLSDNGYYTSFFYGGCASFDGQDKFLKSSNINFILDAQPDTAETERSIVLKKMHRWGIDDRELFDLAINHKKTSDTQPFADIYLTLSTHEPFTFIGIEDYITQAKNIAVGVTGAEREIIDRNIEVFACFKYLDDCVKHLFEYYQTQPGFENTIFVITGDHRIGALAKRLPSISKYHVPLIIYSQMLKGGKTMNGVASHLDITPTINAYLSNNYPYRAAPYCHWLGTSIDTSANFRCHKKQAFMLNNRDVNDFIADTIYLSNNRLFIVKDNLELEQIDNQQLLDSMQENLAKYQIISKFAVGNDYLKKNTVQANLCQINVDFDNSIMKYYESFIVDYDGNKCLRIDTSTAYSSICPRIDFEKDVNRIKIEIRFDIQSLDTSTVLPKFVIEKNGTHPYYYVANIDSSFNSGATKTYSYKSTINFTGPTIGDQMKIYLWNAHKATMLYDNLFVKIDEVE
ncbi:MAG: LTA synthase family protein [Salinivirgaceae bacterium]|nr:LTA synthase family protein [Salinivirgaceae bacterium]